jgi:hypothetical protein
MRKIGMRSRWTFEKFALVPKTTSVSYEEVTNYALAYSLSEDAWGLAKEKFGASAVVYGVPVGVDRRTYHDDAKQKAEELKIQDFDQRAFAYATSALDPTGLEAYKACLLTLGGLQLLAAKGGTSYYSIWVLFVPTSNTASSIRGEASAKNITEADEARLRKQVEQAHFGRRVELNLTLAANDLKKESSVDVKVGDASRSLVLPPLQQNVPPPSLLGQLVGKYQVILRSKGGCNGGAPNSYPANPATIVSDGTNLTANNECGGKSAVNLAPDGKTIFFYGESAALGFSNDGVLLLLTADDGNSWLKLK